MFAGVFDMVGRRCECGREFAWQMAAGWIRNGLGEHGCITGVDLGYDRADSGL